MKFSILHFLGFVALISLQMSHFWLLMGGLVVSFFVLFICICVLAFYSFRKFGSSNTTPENAERVLLLTLINLAIVWTYFLCAPNPQSKALLAQIKYFING